MVRCSAEAILKSAIRPLLVVTGHEAAEVRTALADLPLTFHHAAGFAGGMSASLKTGIAAVPAECTAALICLGDMPFVSPDTLDRLAQYHSDQAAVFPTWQGKRGNPVLLARSLFAGIMALSGDEGARSLLRAIPNQVAELPVDDPGILRDVDRPDALGHTL
jgi:molybdenum cofactor cytidylyltransferase